MRKLNVMFLALVILLTGAVATVAQEQSESFPQATFTVDGMTCGGCVGAVKIRLKDTPGVKDFEVSLEEGEAIVTYDPELTDPETIAASITESGFEAKVKKT